MVEAETGLQSFGSQMNTLGTFNYSILDKILSFNISHKCGSFS